MSQYLSRHLMGCEFHRWVKDDDPEWVLVAVRQPASVAAVGDVPNEDVRGPDADVRTLVWCVDQLLARNVITLEQAADAVSRIVGTSWARTRTRGEPDA